MSDDKDLYSKEEKSQELFKRVKENEMPIVPYIKEKKAKAPKIKIEKKKTNDYLENDKFYALFLEEIKRRQRNTIAYAIILIFFSVTPIPLASIYLSNRAKLEIKRRNFVKATAYLDHAYSFNLFALFVGSLVVLTMICILYVLQNK